MENKTTTTEGFAGGTHVVEGPLTTTLINDISPDLLRNELDTRIVKVRPMATPIDQISRMIGSRAARSMVVEYYSVDSKAITTSAQGPASACKTHDMGDYDCYTVKVKDGGVFAATDTILVPSEAGKSANGNGGSASLMLYVVEARGKEIDVIALNGIDDGALDNIDSGTVLVRMGRAAGELDVQTAQFEALPKKVSNNCQIFKTQVEQTTFARLAAKEVGWTFNDQEEVAIMDMRLGMEKNFLFGVKARLSSPDRSDEVMFTEGIWHQAGGSVEYDEATFDENSVIDIMKTAFTGHNAGASRKILIAGSDLTATINKLSFTRVVNSGDTVTRWGIDFNELRSKFGTLYVVHSEIFDTCGHGADGLIIDPQYLTKYVHVPFKVEHLDMKRTGTRNTDAMVVTEASCLVLRHPGAHVRVVKKPAKTNG